MKEEIAKAIDAAEKLKDSSAAVSLKGKQYLMVKDRVNIFRRIFGFDYGMTTEILQNDKERVLMKTTISDKQGFIIATGYAEEIRDKGVNVAAAIENGESSAWGRALANLGLAGSEVASADELKAAIEKNIKINETLKEELETEKKEIQNIKAAEPVEQKPAAPPPPKVKVETPAGPTYKSFEECGSPDFEAWYPGQHDAIGATYTIQDLEEWANNNANVLRHYLKYGNQDQKKQCQGLHSWYQGQKRSAIEQGRNI
tara:strand:- start:534 stop:1304 length:771 start_codon:yes stop_codon:yes gene_type:complete